MRTLSLLGLAMFAAWVQAKEPAPLEYATSIAGEIVIDPAGEVRSWSMDDGLAPRLAQLVQRNVEQWSFEPILVEGKPVTAKTRMRLALLARPRADGSYELRVENVYFGDAKARGEVVAPRYPRAAVMAGVQARVIVMAKVDEQGNVLDVHVYQTSLSLKRGTDRWRRLFEQASLDAARTSRYVPSDEIGGQRVGGTLTLPFTFEIAHGNSQKQLAADMKRWRAFVPGPVSPAPWVDASATEALDTDELADGGAVALASPFRLKGDVIGKSL